MAMANHSMPPGSCAGRAAVEAAGPARRPSGRSRKRRRAKIDLEVKHLMTDAHEGALKILGEHRTTLDAVVRLLLEREVVEGEEVRRLLAAETAPALRVVSA
jgi:ATP-dependent Zn protease